MYNLKIIIASTRPSRKGHLVADWFYNIAKGHKDFENEILDLKEIDLPLLDEPEHPRLQKYQHEHTKKWSQAIENADAIVIVTPEYNFGMPATIKNAIDFVYNEWNYKPCGIVSYGGLSGGIRSTQMLKQVITAVKMMPLAESVNIPFFTKYIENDVFQGDETLKKSANVMLKELLKWTIAMKPMRKTSS
ncbi:NADPH-dependent FMN reductase [soil metagenome]